MTEREKADFSAPTTYKDTDFLDNKQENVQDWTTECADTREQLLNKTELKTIPEMHGAACNLQPYNPTPIFPDASDFHEVHALTVEGLPGWAQDVVKEVADVRQCPLEFAWSAFFTAIATAIGDRIHVKGKYDNPLMIWVANVAPSGSNKSQPVKDIFAPIEKADAENYRHYREQVKAWKSVENNTEEKPTLKQMLFSDTTPEARNIILMCNPNGTTLSRDEIGGFIDDFGRYNKSGEVSQMLSIFDGTQIRVNRKTDEPLLIEHPYMNIIGSVQPSILATTFGRPQLLYNGFTPRFLFCYPDVDSYPEYSERELDAEIMGTWEDKVTNLINYGLNCHNMPISNAAEKVYRNYYNSLQKEKVKADDYQRAVMSKLQIYAIRVAGLVQVVKYIDSNIYDTTITADTMEYAVKCMRYFRYTADKVHKDCTSSQTAHVATNGELLRMVAERYGIKSEVSLADALGISHQAVNKILKNKNGQVAGLQVANSINGYDTMLYGTQPLQPENKTPYNN
jgi:hypothetical protein